MIPPHNKYTHIHVYTYREIVKKTTNVKKKSQRRDFFKQLAKYHTMNHKDKSQIPV